MITWKTEGEHRAQGTCGHQFTRGVDQQVDAPYDSVLVRPEFHVPRSQDRRTQAVGSRSHCSHATNGRVVLSGQGLGAGKEVFLATVRAGCRGLATVEGRHGNDKIAHGSRSLNRAPMEFGALAHDSELLGKGLTGKSRGSSRSSRPAAPLDFRQGRQLCRIRQRGGQRRRLNRNDQSRASLAQRVQQIREAVCLPDSLPGLAKFAGIDHHDLSAGLGGIDVREEIVVGIFKPLGYRRQREQQADQQNSQRSRSWPQQVAPDDAVPRTHFDIVSSTVGG